MMIQFFEIWRTSQQETSYDYKFTEDNMNAKAHLMTKVFCFISTTMMTMAPINIIGTNVGGIHGDYAYHSDMTKAQMMTLIMFRR